MLLRVKQRGIPADEEQVEGRCERHSFEAAENLCRTCGYEFCHECLVYTYGPKRAPFCVRCAIAAAGVRSSAGITPKASSREIKRELRARKKDGAPAPLAAGPLDLDWAVPAEDDPSAEPQEPDLQSERRHRLPRPKKGKKSKERTTPVDPFESIPELPEELVAAADPDRPALIDPSRPRQPEQVTPPPPPPAPPANPSTPPLVIDELEPEPFDHQLDPALLGRPIGAPTDAAGRPMAPMAPAAPNPEVPAPAAPPMAAPPMRATPPPAEVPVARTPDPVGPRQLVDPLVADELFAQPTAAAPPIDAMAPQQVVGPAIITEGEAPAPFPGPRAADGLPQRTPGAQLPEAAAPRTQPAPPTAPPTPAPLPAPEPVVAAAPPPPPPPPPAPLPQQPAPHAEPRRRHRRRCPHPPRRRCPRRRRGLRCRTSARIEARASGG